MINDKILSAEFLAFPPSRVPLSAIAVPPMREHEERPSPASFHRLFLRGKTLRRRPFLRERTPSPPSVPSREGQRPLDARRAAAAPQTSFPPREDAHAAVCAVARRPAGSTRRKRQSLARKAAAAPEESFSPQEDHGAGRAGTARRLREGTPRGDPHLCLREKAICISHANDSKCRERA